MEFLTDFFASYPWVSPLVILILEYLIGKTNLIKPNSIFDILINIALKILPSNKNKLKL